MTSWGFNQFNLSWVIGLVVPPGWFSFHTLIKLFKSLPFTGCNLMPLQK